MTSSFSICNNVTFVDPIIGRFFLKQTQWCICRWLDESSVLLSDIYCIMQVQLSFTLIWNYVFNTSDDEMIFSAFLILIFFLFFFFKSEFKAMHALPHTYDSRVAVCTAEYVLACSSSTVRFRVIVDHQSKGHLYKCNYCARLNQHTLKHR